MKHWKKNGNSRFGIPPRAAKLQIEVLSAR